VALERGPEVPRGRLGVVKAGGAFAPVDGSHPAERIGWILSVCGARLVLTTSGLAGRVPGGAGWRVVRLDELDLGGPPAAPLEELAALDSAVYVLYTSGSTGRPKGVVLEHHALATYIDFLGGVFGFGPGDRMLQFSSLIFDLAEGELFTGLSRGATVVLVPQEATLSPQALSALMQRERVSYLGAPPAMIALLDPEPYPCLRAMLVGGEAFTGDLVNRWNLPGRVFLNAYGPTEAAIGCTFYPCEHKTWHTSPPIGRAMPNRRVYLLDRWGNPVPPGVPGEIVAAGHGLARGYLGHPALTRQKFIPDPFHPGDRAYRTGDLAMWTPDGQIQFLGRIDTQIKLRGQRIELEEIEVVLASHPAVAHAVVALRADLPGGDGLAAYLVPADNASPPAPAELRRHLAATLPGYMIPAAYVTLTELPLSPTGKINRAALPAPAATDTAHADYTPPRTPTEHLIAAVFTDILTHPRIGANDNFFDLGGNSLQVALVLDRVAEATGVALLLRHFYTAPTVADTASAVDEYSGASMTGAARLAGPVVPIRASGSLPPAFCLPSVSGSAYTYVALARRLASDRPIFGFEAPGLDDDEPSLEQVDELASYYLPVLLDRQPAGPYHLIGYSMGSLVAFEMAQRLSSGGHEVAVLALIDAQPPEPATPPSRADLVQLFADNLAGMASAPRVLLSPAIWADPDNIDIDLLKTELQQTSLIPGGIAIDFLRRRLAVFSASARAMYAYRPQRPYAGRITLIRAAQSPDTRARWARYAVDLDDAVVPGDHYSIWTEPNVAALARILRECLDGADTTTGSSAPATAPAG